MTTKQTPAPMILVPLPGKEHPALAGHVARLVRAEDAAALNGRPLRVPVAFSHGKARQVKDAERGVDLSVLEMTPLKVMLPMAWTVWIDQYGRGVAEQDEAFINPHLSADDYSLRVNWKIDHVQMPDLRGGR